MNIGLNVQTIALGAAALLLGPTIIAMAGGVVRALAKSGIKGSMLAFEKGKELAAETKETLEDLTAEAKAEVKQQIKPVAAKKK
jgi:hypothetical protein